MVKKNIIFISLFLSIFLLINNYYENNIISSKVDYLKDLQFDLLKGGTNNIFIGDSHTYFAINPEYISNNSFNYGYPGMGYDEMFIKINKMLKDNPQINTVFIQYDIHSFYKNLSMYNDVNYWSRYLNTNEIISLSKKNYFNILISKIFPVIGNGNDFFDYFLLPNTDIQKGYAINNVDFSKNIHQNISILARVNVQFSDNNLPNSDAINKFISIINLLEYYNKTIVLIKYPVVGKYLELIEKEKNINIDEKYEYIDNLIINKNILTLDYQKKYLNNYSLFSDQDHLNTKGALLLSKEIVKDLEKLNLTYK